MLEKKSWDKKKSELNVLGNPSPNMRDDAIKTIKKDPMGIKLLRHPTVLNLVEPPGEDDKYLVMITEGIECSLACLTQTDTKDYLREKIPSYLEIKVMMLELLEALNFMHQNAKCVHASLSPENLYLTVQRKLRSVDSISVQEWVPRNRPL